MDGKNIEKLGDELFEAWRSRTPIGQLTEQHPSMTVDEAYGIQQRTIARRRQSGVRVVGKKIGLTSKVVQKMLGVDQPDFGYLLCDMVFGEGEAIPVASLIAPKVEGEIAFVLESRLEGPGITNADVLRATGRTVVTCDNVLPQRGQIVPEPARAALAALYRRHAVGGRGPAVGPRFRRLVRVATTEAVGHGAVQLARIRRGRVLVVDVGCATTDVHSAADGAGVRTVEGDLGVRAAAGGVLVGAQAEGVVDPVEADLLTPTVARMTSEVGYVPGDPGSAAEDRRVAALAAVVAVRRHLRAQAAEREVDLVVLSGGVFRRRDPWGGLAAVSSTLRSDPELAPALADAPVVIDTDFAVAPAGLLAANGRAEAAESLLRDHLLG